MMMIMMKRIRDRHCSHTSFSHTICSTHIIPSSYGFPPARLGRTPSRRSPPPPPCVLRPAWSPVSASGSLRRLLANEPYADADIVCCLGLKTESPQRDCPVQLVRLAGEVQAGIAPDEPQGRNLLHMTCGVGEGEGRPSGLTSSYFKTLQVSTSAHCSRACIVSRNRASRTFCNRACIVWCARRKSSTAGCVITFERFAQQLRSCSRVLCGVTIVRFDPNHSRLCWESTATVQSALRVRTADNSAVLDAERDDGRQDTALLNLRKMQTNPDQILCFRETKRDMQHTRLGRVAVYGCVHRWFHLSSNCGCTCRERISAGSATMFTLLSRQHTHGHRPSLINKRHRDSL